jgi:hypothetical protein
LISTCPPKTIAGNDSNAIAAIVDSFFIVSSFLIHGKRSLFA